MAIPILLPKLSFIVTQGTILEWLKKPGDNVSKGEPLLVIESEKATVEVEAAGTGILGPELAPKGITVPVTTTIGYIINKGEVPPKLDLAFLTSSALEADGSSEMDGTQEKVLVPRPEETGEPKRIKVSPVARRMAQEHGLDLSEIKGSGPGGRITQDDVQAFIKSSTTQKEAQQTSRPLTAFETSARLSGEMIELSSIQRITAERMTLSFQTAPHFYLNIMADMSQAVAMRDKLMGAVQAETGARLSFTDILIFAAGYALKKNPALNVSFQSGKLYRHGEINPCLAVDTSRGLFVPVLRGVDRLSMSQITRRRADLVERARNNRLNPEDLADGTFTISNLGAFGIDVFHAIINPPQAAILAVGRIMKRPIVINDALELRPTVWLSLSVDHRVADGAIAARFMQDLVSYLENPFLSYV